MLNRIYVTNNKGMYLVENVFTDVQLVPLSDTIYFETNGVIGGLFNRESSLYEVTFSPNLSRHKSFKA